jgi:anti-sigma regulatory factor (Ser/Thr protein kinase)
MSSLRLPARLENLNRLMGFLSRCAQERGCNKRRLLEIELASEEALVNIITYAYPARESGDVEVACRPEGDTVWVIEFRDWGVPFNMTTYPEPDLEASVSNRRIGGLGISIIRRMVDQIKYRRERNSNILTFLVRMDP